MSWKQVKLRLVEMGALWAGASLLLGAILTGCASAGNYNTQVPSSSQVYTYVGTQAFTGYFDGVWGATIDHSNSYFNFTDTGFNGSGAANFIGSLAQAGPLTYFNTTYYNLPSNLVTPLYGVEIPGDALAVAQLGDVAGGVPPPITFVESDSCTPLAKAATFQFVEMEGGYGAITIDASTSTWTFSNYTLNQFPGFAGFIGDSAVTLANGSCGQANEGYAATVPATLDDMPITYTAAISPHGFFIMDRDHTHPTLGNIDALPPLVGVEQPSGPLNTADLLAASYTGFWYGGTYGPQVARPNHSPEDQAVSFAAANATSSQIVGGAYPSNDLTQAPGIDVVITPGTQSASSNGLYPSASLTLPDVASICAGTTYAGTNAAGSPTCIFPAVIAAGNAGGKYSMFVTAFAPVANIDSSAGTTMQFLLYQQ